MGKTKLTQWIKFIPPLLVVIAGIAFTVALMKEQAKESQRAKTNIILEDRIGTEEKPYISYEVQNQDVLVTTPFFM